MVFFSYYFLARLKAQSHTNSPQAHAALALYPLFSLVRFSWEIHVPWEMTRAMLAHCYPDFKDEAESNG